MSYEDAYEDMAYRYHSAVDDEVEEEDEEELEEKEMGYGADSFVLPEEVKDHTFHGVPMTRVEFAVALRKRRLGKCAFCGKRIKNQFGNLNKHMHTCKARP